MEVKYKLIDVSYHNGTVDFTKLKAAGIEGAIIRAGYGVSTVDSRFHENVKNAVKSGLHVGVYWFGYAYTVAQAEKEANYCISILKTYVGQIDLPVFYDWEYDSYDYAKRQGVTVSKQLCSDMTAKFCNTLESAGYYAGFYANIDYLDNFYTDTVKNRYALWVAQWSSKCTYVGQYGIWQYTDSGKVDGVSGAVDRSYCYIELS